MIWILLSATSLAANNFKSWFKTFQTATRDSYIILWFLKKTQKVREADWTSSFTVHFSRVFQITLFRVSLISLWPIYRMLPLVNGTFCACLTCSVFGAARRVLAECSSDSFPVSLLALALSLDDALDPRRNPPRSRVPRGELGRASACSILSALEERSRLENKFYTRVSYGVDCRAMNITLNVKTHWCAERDKWLTYGVTLMMITVRSSKETTTSNLLLWLVGSSAVFILQMEKT